jgi:protocatechuate 3,4-dioxygenase beta subunit
MFDDAASCTLTTTDIEGPFFIDDHEFPDDTDLIRSDIREGLAGVETRLYFRLLDARMQCAPIAGAELYIWHCNADGLYSGFNGQDPSKPYMGAASPTPMNKDRFCRGVQLTDASGVASFTTMYPGWYAGRPIHIHLMGRFDGVATRLITTQLYFAAAFTKEVHGSEPAYMARAASIPAGSANPPTGKPAMPTMKHTPGLVTGTLNVIVNRA